MTSSKKLGEYTETEIYEIPHVLQRVLDDLPQINSIAGKITDRNIKHLYLIGAGSSYNAGFAVAYLFNKITKIPTFTEYAMEFQYMIKPILQENDCVIGLSQSGETRDTIESIKIAKSIGCLTIGITNDLNSTLAKTCDHAISLKCNKEKSVLATKTYVSELLVLILLSLEIALIKKTISLEDHDNLINELKSLPKIIQTLLPKLHKRIKRLSNYFKFAEFCFILGAGPDYATAMEASLKLKEGARIFGQAYATAEFPHGPITLADPRAWILAIIPHEEDKRKIKLINLLKRIKERRATILAVFESTSFNEIPEPIDYGIPVPNTSPDIQPILMILAVFLLTLEIAKLKNLDPDQPKFLSKISGI